MKSTVGVTWKLERSRCATTAFVLHHRLMCGACSAMSRCASPNSLRRSGSSVDREASSRPIDLWIAEVTAVEAGRRNLIRMENPAQDVGICHGAADPLQ